MNGKKYRVLKGLILQKEASVGSDGAYQRAQVLKVVLRELLYNYSTIIPDRELTFETLNSVFLLR